MKFEEKLQELRKNKGLTQEEVAAKLFVSRTAVSKWESGKGYPSIDSLKQIANFYEVSLDELLSNGELISLAKEENVKKNRELMDLFFGLLDIALVVFFFLPFFGYTQDGIIYEVSLLNLENSYLYILIPYYVSIIGTILLGITILLTQKVANPKWTKTKHYISIGLTIFETLFFMMSMQPYAGSFTLVLLIIKGVLLLKMKVTR